MDQYLEYGVLPRENLEYILFKMEHARHKDRGNQQQAKREDHPYRSVHYGSDNKVHLIGP